MRASLLLAVLFALLGACGSRSCVSDSSSSSESALLQRLLDPEPATRRAAVEALGRTQLPSRAAIEALVRLQVDDDEGVALSALAALDCIDPPREWVELVQVHGRLESVEHVMIAPDRVHWVREECNDEVLAEGEVLESCWRLVHVGAVYEARVKQFQPVPGREPVGQGGGADHAWRIRSSARVGGDPASVVIADPDDLPEAAEPGDVWCKVATSTGSEWRRCADSGTLNAQR